MIQLTTLLQKPAVELSTYGIKAKFFDEATPPQPVVPDSISWKLTDTQGSVINSRSAVVVTPATEVIIVLSDLDLAIIDGNGPERRVLTVSAVIDSTLGSDLPVKNSVHFMVKDLLGQN